MTIRELMITYGFQVDKNSEKQVENQIQGMKNFGKKVLGKLAVVFSVAKAAQFTKECLGMASTVQEMQNKFDVVFKGMTDDVENWAEQFANSVGRNKNSIKGYLADNQNLFVGMGMARDRAADLSKQLVEGALDIASFNNVQEDVAINAMSKALMGESEAAKTLGAVLNDNTRAMAMNELGIKGKYQALDEATKMEVNYRAIMMQSKDAIGDCVRSMDSYEARQRQLSAAVQYFKEFVGTSLLPVFSVFLGMITKGINFLTDLAKKIIGATEEENRILKLFERIQAIVKKLQPAIDRMMQTLSNGAQKGINFIKGIVDMLGGAENALKLLSLVAGALFIVLKTEAILSFLKKFKMLATVITKIFSIGTLKIMAMVAVIVILALIVEDFINFLLGNDSVIGTIFDKAGIGADNARKKIFEVWKKISEFLVQVWDFLKTAGKMFVDTVVNFVKSHADQIKEMFLRTWGIVKDFLNGVWTFLSAIFGAFMKSQSKDAEDGNASVKDNAIGTWQSILDMLTAVWDALFEAGYALFNALASVVEAIFGAIKQFWAVWGEDITNLFTVLFDTIGRVFNGVITVIKGVADFIAGVFSGDWSKAWDGILQVFSGIWQALVAVLNYAIQYLWLLLKMILTAILALWLQIWGGIKAFFIGIWNGIKAFVSAIISAIVNFIVSLITGLYNKIVAVLSAIKQFFVDAFNFIKNGVTTTFSNMVTGISNIVSNIKSVVVNGFNAAIDFIKGLPSKAITWGTDFMNGLVKGIKAGVGKVTDAVKGVGEKIKSFLHFSVPDEGPLTDYESWMPDFMEGLASGIDRNKDKVIKSVSQLANEMSMLGKAAQANPRTVAASQISNRTTNVTQTVDISNSYSGGTPETQRNVSKAMKKSAYDASTYMARALAYSRG